MQVEVFLFYTTYDSILAFFFIHHNIYIYKLH